nr:ABC-type transport auxiliary lipoprotein family protein [Luteibacter sp. Sphag1AF]
MGVLTACSILPKAESPSIYTLPASPGARPAGGNPVSWSLRVATPNASRTLDSTRIAVVPEANTLSVYAGARWSDNVTHLLRDRLADAFRDSGRIAALSTDDSELQADFELGGTLRSFQTEYVAGKPEVTIRFDATLADTRQHHILASRTFEVRQPVDGKEVPAVVAAFGQASDSLARQVVTWTFERNPTVPPEGGR